MKIITASPASYLRPLIAASLLLSLLAAYTAFAAAKEDDLSYNYIYFIVGESDSKRDDLILKGPKKAPKPQLNQIIDANKGRFAPVQSNRLAITTPIVAPPIISPNRPSTLSTTASVPKR